MLVNEDYRQHCDVFAVTAVNPIIIMIIIITRTIFIVLSS